MPAVPDVVRNKALVAGADAWLRNLDRLVADLEEAWDIRVGAAFDEGTEAFVARAEMRDGTPAVLKLLVPSTPDAAAHEITVLRMANGDGCARLLRADEERGAMLLERLGRSLHQLGLPVARRLEILCDTATRVWRPSPDCDLPTGRQKAEGLAAFIERLWEETGRPCTERAVTYALRCAARRATAHDGERAVLVHGDVHQWNALEADPPGTFKLVDPDGLVAEPEYDLGVLMREDPVELLADGDHRTRARWLAARTGLDAEAIWEWGVVERVSTGLLCAQIDLQPEGREMLLAADAVAAEDTSGG